MEISAVLVKARKEKRAALSYREAKELLDAWSIPTAPWTFARNAEEAVGAAHSIGYPVVMKIHSPDVIHKSDVGGVFTGLTRPEEVAAAYQSIERYSEGEKGSVRMDGVVVERMVSGIEVIVGATRDSQFGSVLMVGMGGVLVELLRDTSFRLIPIEPGDGLEMIRELRGFPVLRGYRGIGGDVESLKTLLMKVSSLVVQYPEIALMDLNPVFVSSSGSIVADVRIQLG